MGEIMMMMGRGPYLPVDLVYGSPPDDATEKYTDESKYVKNLREQMWKVHENARDQLREASNRQKRYYDQRAHTEDYQRGDAVWLLNKSKKKGLSPKLQVKWLGPYLVLRKVSDFVYEIQRSSRCHKQTVCHDRLKAFKGPYTNWLESADTPKHDENTTNSKSSTSSKVIAPVNKSKKRSPPKPDKLSFTTKEQSDQPNSHTITTTRGGTQRKVPSWLSDYVC